MKKFLCFALVVILALAPVAVFAEYDNGDNGYENGYENGYVADEATDVPTDEATDVEPVYVEDTDEGIEAISAELGQVWTLGMGDEAYGFNISYGEVDVYGYVTLDENGLVSVVWQAPFSGLFYITGSVILENSMFEIVVETDYGYTVLADGYEFYELHYELELQEGDKFSFTVNILDEEYEASANWSVVIREVIFLGVEDYPTEEVVEYPTDEPSEEYVPATVNPLADVEVRLVNGVEFVRIRAAANAFGFNYLYWNGETYTVTIVGLEDYPVVIPQVGGFFDTETWSNYVPLSWAVEFFG